MTRFQGEPDTALPANAIAIVGMSCRFAGARGLDAYWSLLRSGLEGVEDFDEASLTAAGVGAGTLKKPNYVRRGAPIEDMECFDAALFGLSPRDAALMDPQHRHFLECTWEAFENAGHVPQDFDGTIGVFAGSGHNAYMPYNLLTNPKLVRDVGLFLLRHTSNDKDFMTTRASYLFDLKGPSINVQTACSTSLVAIHMAAQSLLNGECDMAVAGGSSIELPHRQGYLYEEGEILSPDGHCRPFDADSQGTVFGSGVAVLTLRRLEDAVEAGDHIYAVIRGSAINNDGAGKVGYLAPSVDGQARAIAEALAIADVSADTIDYVEAHGTGTPVGDPIEIAALTQAFRETTDRTGYCAIGSVKANIGHTDTAAGAAGVIKVALAMHNRERPASLNFTAPNPACAFESSPFVVQASAQSWDEGEHPRRAGISSLGVGGTNAHLVMEQAPPRRVSGPSRRRQLLLVSARTDSALRANVEVLHSHLSADPSVNLADMAFTLGKGRRYLERRRAIVVERSDAIDALAASAQVEAAALPCVPGRETAFLFCGAGSQHIDMARSLYDTEPLFRDAVDEALNLLPRIAAPDIRRWLFPAQHDRTEAAAMLERPSIALPALFIVQVALARLWMALGVIPSAMIGHSAGEYAAAHLAGVLDLESGLRIVVERGGLFETVAGGCMLSVPMAEAEVLPLLPAELSIAVINGPRLCVVSGPRDVVTAFKDTLAALEIEAQIIRIAVAAHSGMLDPILAQFRRMMEGIELRAPRIPFASNLTGGWITEKEATDPGYWVRHLRQTVRLTDGLQRLFEDPSRVLLEVGPGRAMSSLAKQHPDRKREQHVISSLPHPDQPDPADKFFWARLGELWELGVAIDWDRYWAGEQRNRIPLPTYRFDRTRHWIEPAENAVGEAETELERLSSVSDWLYEPAWTRTDAVPGEPSVGQALVFEGQGGFAHALVEQLRARGDGVVTVRAGSRRRKLSDDRFEISPANPGDYAWLFEQLAAAGTLPTFVYHCWLVEGRSKQAVQQTLARGVHSLSLLGPELARQAADAPIDIAFVTDRAQRVCDERDLCPDKAAAIGVGRVIVTEYPNLRVRCIDISDDTAASDVIDELNSEVEVEPIAYRGRERWVRHQKKTASRAVETHPLLRPEATYLVTGGLGGLGMTIARHLAKEYRANIALVSRRALPPRDKWDDILNDGADLAMVERLRSILALESSGSRVEIVTADVADARAMRRGIARVARTLGPIAGVFHAAGTLDDALLDGRSRAAANAVMRPKIDGTLALETSLRGQKPDFVILFSSVSALAGLAGQADYAAANTFLDAYADARRNDPHTRVISVAWTQWGEVGMAATLGLSDAALPPIADGSGKPVAHPFFDSIHSDDGAHDIVGTLSTETHWLLDEHRVAGLGALVPGTGYLELARAAHELIEPGAVTISDVTFFSPFTVGDAEARQVRVRLTKRGDAHRRFSVLGRRVGGDDAWTEHATGVIAPAGSVESQTLDITAVAARCGSVTSGPIGKSDVLRFGPRWQNVSETAIGEGEALLRLKLPDAFVGDLAEVGLHPALLDLATAGAQSLIRGYDHRADFFAPFSYRRLVQHDALPQRIVSHIRLRPGAHQPAQMAIFDVTIADEGGRVLVEIEEFTMMRVRDPAAMAQGSTARIASTSVTTGDRVEPILPEEGIAAIETLLAGPARPHVVVSPYPLESLLKHLRAPRRAAGKERRRDTDSADLPATETERVIAGLWEDLLGIDEVRRNDDFFDLGGHSLLAVQFTNRFRKKTGKVLPLAMMLDTPTVANLARAIDPDGSRVEETSAPTAPEEVVRIKAGGDLPPIFFVHDGLGETLLYRGLAVRLDTNRPVFGIEPRRTASGQFAHTAIAEMAADYVARLRTVQPRGPYLLAGLCAGGVIAFEMARQLEQAGEQIAFVGMIDAADVEASKQSFYITRMRMRRIAALAQGSRGIGVVPALVGKVFNAVRWEISSRLNRAREQAIVARMEAAPADVVQSIPFLKLYEVAHRSHRPQGLLGQGEVTLFKATVGTGAVEDIPYGQIYADVALGWGRRSAGEIRIVEVPGGHGSALQEPHVATLARHFQDAIDSAMAHRDRVMGPTTDMDYHAEAAE